MFREGILINSESNNTLTEHEIFKLQDCFLIPGIYNLNARTMEEGRNYVKPLLSIVNATMSVAYLSTSYSPSEPFVTSLIGEFQSLSLLEKDESAWEAYVSSSFYYDVLIIESNDQLENSSWFCQFKILLDRYRRSNAFSTIILEQQA